MQSGPGVLHVLFPSSFGFSLCWLHGTYKFRIGFGTARVCGYFYEYKDKKLMLPMPLLVFPMSRSKPPSFRSSSELCSGAKTAAWICSCSVCLYAVLGVRSLVKHPLSLGGYKFFWGVFIFLGQGTQAAFSKLCPAQHKSLPQP